MKSMPTWIAAVALSTAVASAVPAFGQAAGPNTIDNAQRARGDDNKATFRPVRVGIAGDKYFEVVSGLSEKDRIVAGTYQAIRELKDGAAVRQTQEKQETATASAKSS